MACNGEATGEIIASATSEITNLISYQINNNGFVMSNLFNNLRANSYRISAMDSLGCQKDTVITINEPTKLNLSILSVKDERCAALCDGIVSFEASGGVPSYIYTSNNGVKIGDSIFTNNCVGNYMGYVTDANKCRDSVSYSISGPQPLNINSRFDSICVNSPITLFVNANGGSLISPNNYLYNWGSNIITSVGNLDNVFPTQDTIYNVFIVDDSLCISDTIKINVHLQPDLEFSVSDSSGCIEHTVEFTPVLNNNVTLDSCFWDFGDGNNLDVCSNNDIFNTYINSGFYDVSYYARTTSGCEAVIVKKAIIEAFPKPIADFITDPQNRIINIFNTEVLFTNQSIGANFYEWRLDDTTLNLVDIAYDFSDLPPNPIPCLFICKFFRWMRRFDLL